MFVSFMLGSIEETSKKMLSDDFTLSKAAKSLWSPIESTLFQKKIQIRPQAVFLRLGKAAVEHLHLVVATN